MANIPEEEYIRECIKYINRSPYSEQLCGSIRNRNAIYLAHQMHLTMLVSHDLNYEYGIEELEAELPVLLMSHQTLTRSKYNELLVYGNSNNFTIRSSHLLID